MDGKTCCITGHCPQVLPWGSKEEDPRCQQLKRRMKHALVGLITEHNVRNFISGMSPGASTWAAELILDLRGEFPITLECALPCEAQAISWTEDARNRYFSIVRRCDKETMVQRHFTADCYQKHNRSMIDQSYVVLAGWNCSSKVTGISVVYDPWFLSPPL